MSYLMINPIVIGIIITSIRSLLYCYVNDEQEHKGKGGCSNPVILTNFWWEREVEKSNITWVIIMYIFENFTTHIYI